MRAPLSLRGAVTGATLAITLVALIVSVALVSITSIQQRNSSVLMAALRSVQVAERMQADLLAYDRARGFGREAIGARLRQSLVRAERRAGPRQEAELVAAIRSGLATYFKDPAAPKALERTYRDLEDLAQMNILEAEIAAQENDRWDRRADMIALGLGALILVLSTMLLLWLRRSTIVPVTEISQALGEFSAGNESARAPEIGPAELRTIARHFNAMAETLSRQKANQLAFLAGVAHDLRSPMSTVSLSLDLVDSAECPPRVAQVLRVVKRQVDRLERMAGDLIDATRVESGYLELRARELDLRTIANEAFALFAGSPESDRIRLHLPDTDVRVVGDDMRLEQVAANLVSNALKYSPDGTQIEIGVRRDGDNAVLWVSDNGIGIREEDLPRLFEPFGRVGALKDLVPGVGLGLSVARRIVTAHRGAIRVHSTPGKGSTFEVVIPSRASAGTEHELTH